MKRIATILLLLLPLSLMGLRAQVRVKVLSGQMSAAAKATIEQESANLLNTGKIVYSESYNDD